MATAVWQTCPSCLHQFGCLGKFCVGCGAKINAEANGNSEAKAWTVTDQPTCPSCGQQQTSGSQFCGGCGTNCGTKAMGLFSFRTNFQTNHTFGRRITPPFCAAIAAPAGWTAAQDRPVITGHQFNTAVRAVAPTAVAAPVRQVDDAASLAARCGLNASQILGSPGSEPSSQLKNLNSCSGSR
jgi:hypothetical protein